MYNLIITKKHTKQKLGGLPVINFTSNTYKMKREILTFSNKISKKLPKPERKFMADMNYGMLASGSRLLTDIADKLHELSRKINVVDRLSNHLAKGIPACALNSYLSSVKKWCPEHPVVHIDDSDVVKPSGYKFESLCLVRDGSESTVKKNIYKKGYHVTEATVLTNNAHPASLFSKIHSSNEKNFTSINDVTFSAIERAISLFGKAKMYFSRWRIEEYFRCKKQMFKFENFRVRKLKAINALNFYITLCIAFLAQTSMKSETNAMKATIIKASDPIKEKVSFYYDRLAKGIQNVLSYAKEGVRLWFKTERPVYRQLCFKFIS